MVLFIVVCGGIAAAGVGVCGGHGGVGHGKSCEVSLSVMWKR